jgi:hypothetical protein
MDGFAEISADQPYRTIPCADGVEGRRIEIRDGVIRVCRRIAGVEAWVNAPVASYRGVTLRVSSAFSYEIALLHVDPALDLVLARAPDDRDVIALWRRYGRMTGLPLLVEDSAGRLQPMEDKAAPVASGRRAGSSLRHRRPRFLARREAGRVSGADAA